MVVRFCCAFMLAVIFCCCPATGVFLQELGGPVMGEATLPSRDRPYEVRLDVIVQEGATLNIEAGVEIRFAPGIGITVLRNGVLKAMGEAGREIVFTKLLQKDSYWAEDESSTWPAVRLVDGDSILEGRLQMYYKGKWRSVCTNSKNWTENDLRVMCHQLGFTGGSLYRWFPRNNASSQMLYEKPNCTGEETMLSACPQWSDRQIGSGVCDYHEDIGIQCDGNLGNSSTYNWRGIKFIHAKAKHRRPIVNKVDRLVSLSCLKHVSVLYAGSDEDGNVSPAVDVIGMPPEIDFINVMYSAYDGIRLYDPQDAYALQNSVIAENRGFGVFINSSISQITLVGTRIRDNGGDGIHYVYYEDFQPGLPFCKTSNILGEQIYPVRQTIIQTKGQLKNTCSQVFVVAGWTNQVLTVNFLGLTSDAVDERYAARMKVYDGPNDSNRLLANVPILNNTYAPSVTSTRQKILLKYESAQSHLKHYVAFTVEIIANLGRAYDMNVTDCTITGNNGRGILIQNQRSGILVNRTRIIANGYLAGLDVTGGSGEVIVNNSYITGNEGDGINITSAGGYMHIDWSSIANNTGRGISFWFNESSTNLAFNHSVHITRSEIAHNSLHGILMGNQCRYDSFWNISLNAIHNNMDSGLLFHSCQQTGISIGQATIFVTHNQFLDSHFLALDFSPILHAHLIVEHNEFRRHERGTLLVGSVDEDIFLNVPVMVEIQWNYFAENSGAFVVNVGVLADGGTESIQRVMFTKNRLENNDIVEQFPSLNPRSRVAAVVVVTSANVVVFRNSFHNVGSKYDLGSHIEKHDVIINSTYNFWNSKDPREVYGRIFDCKDRYNLACAEFLPFLLRPSDLDSTSDVSEVNERDKVIPFRKGMELGGEISGFEVLPFGEYNVRRDIFVHTGGGLDVQPGVVLKFDQSVGMMVQGRLISESNDKPITYTLLGSSEVNIKSRKLRLSNHTEGRLDVYIDGRWGSVCYYGWDIIDAAIACHQLGLILHPEDWLLEQSQFQHSTQPFLLSNVQCTVIDTDITLCRAEKDFENSCSTEVGLKCHLPSWSGIRLGMAAEESRLKNVIIERAGLFDYTTNMLKPALQIDFNRHVVQNIIVRHNTDSGLGVMWNEMFLSENRQVLDSEFISNQRHGIVTHAQGLNVIHCSITDNKGSGILYNPVFTKSEQRDLVNWVHLKDPKSIVRIPDQNLVDLRLVPGERIYLMFTRNRSKVNFKIQTHEGHSLGIMVLNPFNELSTEDMTIYGNKYKASNIVHWNLRKNLTSFPLKTPGYAIYLDYDSGVNPSGKGILYISSVEGQRNRPVSENIPIFHVHSSTIRNCHHGFSSHHYNRDISVQGDHFHRYSNETILITNTSITESKSEAIFVWTPFWDPIIKNLAEVNYTIISCEIKENAKGLLHYSRDIRNSNNLFHWTINNTVFSNNANGGIDIRLPYVWQYSENYTHSFSMHNSTLIKNRNFEFLIDGHFAEINMSHNVFQENFCKRGVISISGMEKEMLIEENTISNNSGQFAVEFNLQSHADKFGLIPAEFYKNIIERNRDAGMRPTFGYQPANYAIAIRGVQSVNITRNLIENRNLQFELLAGVLTGSLDNSINVGRNWWGSNNVTLIRKRIFDFEDWNCYALANFSPYLAVPVRDGATLKVEELQQMFQLDGMLGGRIFGNVRLQQRYAPYTVSSDLTVMPDSLLTIDPGVVIEFFPSVGILALGDIVAQGRMEKPIVMRPVKIVDEIRFKRNIGEPKSRLCVTEKCKEKRNDGFLEIFNSTTEQWVPICDARFTERNAQVVCKELGFGTLNVHVKRGPRLDIGPTQVSRIRSWPHPLECIGIEEYLVGCEYRLNGYVDDYGCKHTDDFIYIYCGNNVLEQGVDHWGGIRFSIKSLDSQYLNRPTISYSPSVTSRLEYIHIQGAGVLHGEKSGAIQMSQREVHLNYLNITESASHGVEVIAVPGSLSFNELRVENNLGAGFSFLSLTGESSENDNLGYDPLLDVNIPYSVFGLVDMCDINKKMIIKNRILLYYKYDNKPVDCVKIFSSLYSNVQIGFRLLQFNLFNGTGYSALPDRIVVYNGDIFNTSRPELAQISWQFGHENATKFYTSSGNTLSIHLHTIGGSGKNGFIAEVVTLPISHPIARDIQHNISYSNIKSNCEEGIAYRSVGEITPAITIRYNRITDNGQELFGNFTISDSAVLLNIQNAQRLYFHNNLIMQNQGGLSLQVDSHTSVSSLRGLIVNNLFTENRNKETLIVQGRKSGAFQFLNIYRNYFSRNYAEFRDNIVLAQVVSNMTENIAYNNTGKHLLDVQGFEKMPLSYQVCQNNWFWRNSATDYWDRSTIMASKAGQRFNHNYLVNPDNDFELAAMNRSILEGEEAPIDATNNWWGFNRTAAISGRIKDHSDMEELLEVRYIPFLHDNTSVLSGKCAGGWTKIGDTCFLYVGGIMTFAEAKRFCELDNASMPYIKTMHDDLMRFVEDQQFYYHRYSDRVWIQSIDVSLRECAVLVNRKVITRSCEEYFPFLCERDPEITVTTRLWFMEPLTIAFCAVTLLALVFVFLCLGFWLCKSRRRYKEKLERRNSIRASIHSNRSLTGFSELGYKRRIEKAFQSESSDRVQDLRLNGSVDSIEKPPSHFSCSMDDSYDNTAADTSTSRVENGHYPDFVNRYHQDAEMENTAVNMMVHPTFDLTYENQGYIDRSVSRNSHEISRDWSSTTSSTLDMKHSLDHEAKCLPYNNRPYQNIPSPHLTSSRESNCRDGASSCSSNRAPPLETAM